MSASIWAIASLSASLAAAACSAPPACRVVDEYIWPTLGGMGQPPRLEWRSDVCPGLAARRAVRLGDACYAGLFWPPPAWFVEVAWTPPDMPLADTALAHELQHAAQWQRGLLDAEHSLAEDWERVEEIDAELRRMYSGSLDIETQCVLF